MAIINQFPGGGGGITATCCTAFIQVPKHGTYTSGSSTYFYKYANVPKIDQCSMYATTYNQSGSMRETSIEVKFYVLNDCQCDVYYKLSSESSQTSTYKMYSKNLTKGHLYTATNEAIYVSSSSTSKWRFSLRDVTEGSYVIRETSAKTGTDYAYRTMIFTAI